jgi:hypothetical protein
VTTDTINSKAEPLQSRETRLQDARIMRTLPRGTIRPTPATSSNDGTATHYDLPGELTYGEISAIREIPRAFPNLPYDEDDDL